MTSEEATMFNFFMAIILLSMLQRAIEKGEKEKAKKIWRFGIIYSTLCQSTLNNNYHGHH